MTDRRIFMLDMLQERLGYKFSDIAYLNAALTHSSYAKGDGKGVEHNERLEYLGDAVLELCISEQLYLRHPDWSEGAMTRARAGIVCETALNELARAQFSLQDYLLLGHGEELCGGRDKPSIVSDALEALIGALYLDGGIENARAFVLRFAGDALAHAKGKVRDYKTALQEYVQKWHMGAVSYRLADTHGPDHQKEFCMHVYLNDTRIGEGGGSSKQEAGQQAARMAIQAVKAMKEE